MTENQDVVVEQVNQGFAAFGQIQQELQSQVLSQSPHEIATWDDHKIATEAEALQQLKPGKLGEIAALTFTLYVARERQIEAWWQESQLNTPDADKKQLIKTIANGRDLSGCDSFFEKTTVQRIHGGIALVVEPALFQKLVKPTLHTSAGEINSDEEVLEQLNQTSEVGFLLDPSELPAGLLPEGINIALIQNTPGFERSINHEEAGELLGLYIDHALTAADLLNREEERNLVDETLALALYDTAARIDEGISDLSLGVVGLTPEYAQTHPTQAKIMHLILSQAHDSLTNSTTQQRNALAADIRSGILAPKNILRQWLNQSNVNREIKKVELQSDDFYKEGDFSISSERKGRFVFNKPTLNSGDLIEKDQVFYRVTDILKQGGQGVVYNAEMVGAPGAPQKKVVIKELIFEAPEILISSPDLAELYIRHLRTLNPNPDDVMRSLIKLAGDADFGPKYVAHILSKFIPKGGPPQYHTDHTGFANFSNFDSQTGKKIPDFMIIGQITSAAREFVNLPETVRLRNNLHEAKQMFIAESEILSKLHGIRGVVGSLGIAFSPKGEFNPHDPTYNSLYLIQEFVEGQNLDDMLYGTNPVQFNQSQSVEFISQFLAVLQQIHSREVLHKDIKPGNIMVNSQGLPIIIDFGIAKGHTKLLEAANQAGARNLTTRMGTVGYVAPEQLNATNPSTDIFQTGMLFYALVTGENPQDHIASTFGLKNAQQRYEYMRQQLRSHRILQPVADIILKATHYDSSERYQKVSEMLVNLNQLKLIARDTQLDALGDRTNRGLYRDFAWHKIRSESDLPQPFQDYFQALDETLQISPDSSLDVARRLERLFTSYYTRTDARRVFAPIIAKRLIDISQKRIDSQPNHILELAYLDLLQGPMSELSRYKKIEPVHLEYFHLLQKVADRDPSCIPALLDRTYELFSLNNFNFPDRPPPDKLEGLGVIIYSSLAQKLLDNQPSRFKYILVTFLTSIVATYRKDRSHRMNSGNTKTEIDSYFGLLDMVLASPTYRQLTIKLINEQTKRYRTTDEVTQYIYDQYLQRLKN